VWLLKPALASMIDRHRLWYPLVVGPRERVHLGPDAVVGNAILNAESGTISIERDAFFGQNVLIAAGTHEPELFGSPRFHQLPRTGHDVVVGEGAWIASRAIIIGPCVIGRHAVVAAGSVVTRDVEPYTMVAGVPARFVRRLSPPEGAGYNEVTHEAVAAVAPSGTAPRARPVSPPYHQSIVDRPGVAHTP
jgi:acetyltransferase-like isoleucine patch superfamily enzyme